MNKKKPLPDTSGSGSNRGFNAMNEQIVRISAQRRKPTREYRDDSPQGIKLDMLTLRALAELVVDVMEERGAVPPAHELTRRAG